MPLEHTSGDDAVPRTAINLGDECTRNRLTPIAVSGIIRLAEIWHLTSVEICALLGGISERTWFRMKKGEWSGNLSQDTLTRVSALLGIYKGLRLFFSQPLADEWVKRPNNGPLFEGRRPIDLMIEGGVPELLAVRRHVHALLGGL